MVLQKKKVRKVLAFELKVALAIFVLALVFQGPIKTYIKPPVMDFVGANIDLLKTIILFVFLFCSMFLILIVWLLEWGDKQQKSVVTKFVSRLVCENYYGNYRKSNVYRAIKTALSKFSRDAAQEEDTGRARGAPGAPARYIDPTRFAIKKYSPEQDAAPAAEDTSDGIHVIYFPNGKVEQEMTYRDNKLDGLYRSFYEDGTLHQERFYKEGKLDGIYKAYDEFGVPYFDSMYRADKREGITNIYFKNGTLQYRDRYENGKRVHRETYSETGELKFSQQEYES